MKAILVLGSLLVAATSALASAPVAVKPALKPGSVLEKLSETDRNKALKKQADVRQNTVQNIEKATQSAKNSAKGLDPVSKLESCNSTLCAAFKSGGGIQELANQGDKTAQAVMKKGLRSLETDGDTSELLKTSLKAQDLKSEEVEEACAPGAAL